MAKFVKLEDGTFINIDKIIKIEKAHYEYLFSDKAPETSDDEYIVLLSGSEHEIPITITKNGVDDILKVVGKED